MVWVLKSERVLISESIEATPINHASYVRARISLHVAASTYVARTIVATKLWQCEKRPRAGVPSFADILATRLFKQRVLICE